MAELTIKVKECEKKETSNHDHIHKLDVKMDQYLSKLKEDVDKIAGKNKELFNQFLDQVKVVDSKYEEHAKKMQKQQEFFEANKASYQENLIKMEQVIARIKTQESVTEEYVKELKEETAKLDARINDKEKQNADMLNQVVDIDHKVLECTIKMNA